MEKSEENEMVWDGQLYLLGEDTGGHVDVGCCKIIGCIERECEMLKKVKGRQ
jgi:hypothetical protein